MAVNGTVGAVRSLASALGTITGVSGLIGIGGMMAGVKGAVDSANSFVEVNRRLALTMDMPIEQFQAFTSTVSAFGFELDDVRQAMTQFYGVAGEAKTGTGSYFEMFKQAGIDMTLAENKMASMPELLQKFAVQIQNIRGSDRTSILAQIFGDDDATKVGLMLEAMADTSGYAKAYGDTIKDLKRSGALITDADIALSKAYRGQISQLGTAFEGLKMSIYRAFGPTFIRWMKVATEGIIKYRHQIVRYLVGAYNRFIILLRDVLKVFFNLNTAYEVQHKWLYKLQSGVKEFMAVMGQLWRIFNVVGKRIADELEGAIGGTDFGIGNALSSALAGISDAEINAFIDKLILAFNHVKLVAMDMWAIISGRGYNVQTGIGRQMRGVVEHVIAMIASMRDAVQPVLEQLYGLFGFVGQIMAWVQGVYGQLVEGFNSGNIDPAVSAWTNIGAALKIAADWITEFAQQLYGVFVLQQDATGRFAWINDVIKSFQVFWGHVKTAWGWFQALYQKVDEFFTAMGWDLGGTLMFLGLLKLTGVLDGIFGALGLVMSAISIALPLALGTAGAAVTTFVATVAGWTAGLMAAFWAGKMLADLLDGTFVDRAVGWVTDKMYGVEDAFAKVREQGNAIADAGGTRAYAQTIRSAAAPVRPVAAYPDGGYVTAGGGAPALHPVTINIPGGRQIHAMQTPDQLDEARSYVTRSATGGY